MSNFSKRIGITLPICTLAKFFLNSISCFGSNILVWFQATEFNSIKMHHETSLLLKSQKFLVFGTCSKYTIYTINSSTWNANRIYKSWRIKFSIWSDRMHRCHSNNAQMKWMAEKDIYFQFSLIFSQHDIHFDEHKKWSLTPIYCA